MSDMRRFNKGDKMTTLIEELKCVFVREVRDSEEIVTKESVRLEDENLKYVTGLCTASKNPEVIALLALACYLHVECGETHATKRISEWTLIEGTEAYNLYRAAGY